MATNYLSLRSSAAASLTAVNLTLSTLTGSTITGSTITAFSNATTKSLAYSTLQGSSITTSTMTGSTLAISSLLQISTSGLLGIGTNPTQALHVQGSTIVSGAIGIGSTAPTDVLNLGSGNVVLNNNAAQASGFLYNQNSIWGGVEVEGLVGTGAQTINMGVNTNRSKAWSSAYNGLWIRVDNRTTSTYNGFHFFNKTATTGTESELMTILSTGYVGIGSSNPGGILQVTNNAGSYTIPTVSISDGIADNVGTYGMVNLTRPMAPGDNKGHIAIIASGYRVGLLGYLNNTTTMGWVSANTMNTSNGIFLNSSGNVGIGTNSPSFKLVVDNGSTAGINAVIQASGITNGTTSLLLGKNLAINNCATILWNHVADGSAANYLGLGYYAGDNKLNITCNGSVGIGTTNPAQTLDVYGTIARNSLKLPRVDYGNFTAGSTVSIPILFSDTQYSHVEIRVHYVVSAQCQMTMSALDTVSASMNIEEASLTTYQWNSQTAAFYNITTGTPTSFNFANNVETYGIDNILVMRIVRSTGGSTTGFRNHYMYDNTYCIYNVGTARGYGMGHINNTSLGGNALASFRLSTSAGNISGNWSTTHYN